MMLLDDARDEFGPLTILSMAGDHGDGLIEMAAAMRRTLPESVAGGGLVRHVRRQLHNQILRIPSYERKRCIILPGPEFVLLEALADIPFDGRVLMALDDGLSGPVIERVSRNIPERLNAEVLRTPVLPPDVSVEDSVIVVAGLDCGPGCVLVPHSATRLLGFYRSFYTGDVAFLDAMGERVAGSPDGSIWTTVQRSSLCTCAATEKPDINERLDEQLEATVLSSQNRSRSAGPPESSSVFVLALVVGIVGGILAAMHVVHLRRAMANYRWGVLCFFVSLDIFTSIVVTTGIMDRAALFLAGRSRGMPLWVMLLFGTLLFLVSAFMNNLTAVLIVLPIIFVLLRAIRLQRRFVAGFFAMLLAISNLAGASTPIGDFPALIIMKSGLTSFGAYLARAFPLFAGTAVIVIIGHLILARSTCRSSSKEEETCERTMSLALLHAKYRYAHVDYRAVTRMAVIFLLMFAAWATLPAGLVPPELVAVLGLSAAALMGPRGGSARLYRSFDLKPVITVGIFLFIAALVQDSGILVWLATRLNASIEDPLLLFCAVMALTAACSGLFSAGPAAAAMMPLIVEMAHGPFSACSDWLAVGFAVSICAGSSLFVWSATAGLPLAQKVADASLRDPAGGRLPWGVRQYLPYGIAHFVVQLSVGMVCVILAVSGLLTEAGTAQVLRGPVWANVLLDEQLFPEKDGECFWDEVENVYLSNPGRYGNPVLLTGADSEVEPEQLVGTYGRPEIVEVRDGVTWHGYGAFLLGIRSGNKTYTQVRAPVGFFLRGFRPKAELAIADSANGDEPP